MSKKSRRRQALNNQTRRLSSRISDLNALSNRFSWYRMSIILSGLAIGIASYYLINETLGWMLIGAMLVVFNIVAFFHRRVERSINKHQIWLNLRLAQVARMDLDWRNIPESRNEAPDPDHPFELDLDITGKKSLHRLVDITISQDGGQLLRQWLVETEPKLQDIRERQGLIKELAPLARFRDELFLAYNLAAKDALEGKKLRNFLQNLQMPGSFKSVWVSSIILAALNIALFTLHILEMIPAFWIISLTIYGTIYFMNHGFLDSLLDDSVLMFDELKKFKVISHYLESYNYARHENLKNLCQPFQDPKNRPSKQLRRSLLTATAVGLRMNPLVRLILNAPVPWDFLCVHLLNKHKRILADALPTWLKILAELEALMSLANFAYLNPDNTFPKIILEKNFVFQAKNLGHPLIPDSQRKCNDFAFDSKGKIALITGSNMSGKSTFLKTIGINLCLAFAGGPVNTQRLQTSLFRIYTSIKINDSVIDGFSFFYAEVRRLKALLNELEKESPVPVLFLIDEIFKGTNNRERYIGGRSFIQALVGKNGLGAVATHDLELTKLADRIGNVTNYHFKEHVEQGKMVFDYKLRPGPCPTTNALKIMRMEGLPVEELSRKKAQL